MKTKLSLILCLPVLALMLGCANPADDVIEAEVGTVQPSSSAAEGGVTYAFTDDSSIGFVGSKVTGSHEGGFNEFSGEFVVVDNDPLQTTGMVTIDMESTWSDNDRLTGHLKNEDFFHVEKFPTSTFELTDVEEAEEGYILKGNLTLHGVKKGIQFPATIEMSDGTVALKAEFFIKRFDFGIEYPGRADDLIRDEVVIRLDLKAETTA